MCVCVYVPNRVLGEYSSVCVCVCVCVRTRALIQKPGSAENTLVCVCVCVWMHLCVYIPNPVLLNIPLSACAFVCIFTKLGVC